MAYPTTSPHVDVAGLIEEDPGNGVYRANRVMFTDEELFELEMKHIFEGNWVYLAHESQVAEPGDYFTTYIGRQPIVITRDKDGGLNCLINACAHRGAMPCRRKTDNRLTLTCPFHGWTFRNSGELLKVKDPDDAGYPSSSTPRAPTTSPRWRASRATAGSCSAASTSTSSRSRSTSATP